MTRLKLGAIKFLLDCQMDKDIFIEICKTSKFYKQHLPIIEVLIKLAEQDLEINALNFVRCCKDKKTISEFMKVLTLIDRDKYA